MGLLGAVITRDYPTAFSCGSNADPSPYLSYVAVCICIGLHYSSCQTLKFTVYNIATVCNKTLTIYLKSLSVQ